jgi:hypothetical protein
MERIIVPKDHPLQEDDCERFLLEDEEVDVVINALRGAAIFLQRSPRAGLSKEVIAGREMRIKEFNRIRCKLAGED